MFMNHGPEVSIVIAESLVDWIRGVVTEIKTEGALLHPADYRQRPGDEGMYEKVLNELRGVDCELNR